MRKKVTATPGPPPSDQCVPILRYRTAIRRLGNSRSVALAQAHGLITADSSFFDYGRGLGEDVHLLKTAGIHAEGCDPHYRPNGVVQAADW